MTAPANDALLITLLASFTGCVGYAAGRLHQWYRTGLDRDEAYRDGYDTATRSVFSMAARLIGPRRAVRGTAAVTSAVITTAPAVPGGDVAPGGGRHLVPDELVQGPTYRLTPDRVARAKVRDAEVADEGEQQTTRLPSVPRPRSS
ncbi:hypothetical protein [Actinoplanes sp. NPDC049681]|uniref:hypothetical protein n=1 Tax=Actinoplanes sp. NPDC049681 TaxID=3363905 RepID=UPI0037AB082A